MSFASDRAIEILNRYWNRQLPVDIHAIAKDMNVNVVERHEWGAITPPDGITAQESDRSYDISGRFDYVNNIPTLGCGNASPWRTNWGITPWDIRPDSVIMPPRWQTFPITTGQKWTPMPLRQNC